MSIEPGNDLVGRFGDTVILISRSGPADATAGELLALVAELAADTAVPATAVAARLAGWVLGNLSGNVAPFGIVTPVPEGVVVFLRGPVRCAVGVGDSVRQLSGEQALTWVDQIVPGTFDWIAVGGAEGSGVQPDPVSDLRVGVVPGRGFVLTGVAAAGQADVGQAGAAPAYPAGAGVNGAGNASASAGDGRPEPAEREPEPEPEEEDDWAPVPGPASPAASAEPAPARPDPAESRPETVLSEAEPLRAAARAQIAPTIATGALPEDNGDWSGGHPQHAMDQSMPAAPSAGILRSQDGGIAIVLDRPYVLGREPGNDPAVRNGDAEGVRLHDPDNVISRVHAYVSVIGGTVVVRDASSAQGTWIGGPGDPDWTRVGLEGAPLPTGWSLRIGEHIFILQPDNAEVM